MAPHHTGCRADARDTSPSRLAFAGGACAETFASIVQKANNVKHASFVSARPAARDLEWLRSRPFWAEQSEETTSVAFRCADDRELPRVAVADDHQLSCDRVPSDDRDLPTSSPLLCSMLPNSLCLSAADEIAA